MMGILDSVERKALKNRRKVENQILELKKQLEKFNVSSQTKKEKEEIYEIMSQIEELSAMIYSDSKE
jgi:hypothetical protein